MGQHEARVMRRECSRCYNGPIKFQLREFQLEEDRLD